MQPLTMELVERLDRQSCLGSFLRHTRRQTLGHEDNQLCLAKLAEDLDLSPGEISSYIWLQMYIRELVETYDDIPDADVVAQQMGIDLDKLREYIGRREVEMSEALGFDSQLLLLESYEASAEEERLMATSHGMTVQEYRDYIEDLQQDADLQG